MPLESKEMDMDFYNMPAHQQIVLAINEECNEEISGFYLKIS